MVKNQVLRLLRLVTSNRSTSAGFIIVAGLVATAVTVAIGGYSVLLYDPIKQNVGPPFAPPNLAHPFGTDRLGRDVLSRVLYSAPNALLVSIVVISSALLIGMILGSFAGYIGGYFDEILMRITDIFLGIPGLILAVVVSVILGPGVINVMYALIITWWPAYARMARGETLRVAQYNYIEAARASGLGSGRIILKHIIPNIFIIMMIYATIDFGQVIMVYSGLSYLGLAVRPPYPDWGEMVSSYKDYMISAPWLPLFPGAVIALLVLGFGLLGDGLRDAIEARV